MSLTGKQAIHPAQVSIIQKAFAPSDAGEDPPQTRSFAPPLALTGHDTSSILPWIAQPVLTLELFAAACEPEISRAQAILEQYEAARTSGAGAYGLKGSDGQTEMIDAPMVRLLFPAALLCAQAFG